MALRRIRVQAHKEVCVHLVRQTSPFSESKVGVAMAGEANVKALGFKPLAENSGQGNGYVLLKNLGTDAWRSRIRTPVPWIDQNEWHRICCVGSFFTTASSECSAPETNREHESTKHPPKLCDLPTGGHLCLIELVGFARFLLKMGASRRLDTRWVTGLPLLLLMVTVAELVIYRLLVPALRPRGDVEPALWHSILTYIGLFLFYFASALAVGVVAHQLWQVATGKDRFGRIGVLISAFGAAFLVLASMSIVTPPSALVTFLLEGAFVVVLFFLLVGQWLRRSDLGVALGLILLALPLLVHFYAPLTVRYIDGEEALFNGLTDRVENIGRWLVLLAALSMPYFFGARPFLLRAARLPPLIAAMLVALLGAALIRNDYETGMQLAQNGLGISAGPSAPGSRIALYLLALSAVAWTFVNCVTAPSEQRRNIGIGIALIVGGGYAFSWPLQYLAGLAGVFTIARAANTVRAEERSLLPARVPSIDDEVWKNYLANVVERLREVLGEHYEEPIKVLSIRGDEGQTRSYFVYEDQKIPVTVTMERNHGSVVGLDVRCGDGGVKGQPVWTLHHDAIADDGLMHPPPPKSSSQPVEVSGLPTELRDDYEVIDRTGWSKVLFAGDLGERLAAHMPGWVACWPDGTLRMQIYPGRGASLHEPIPIVALAQGDASARPEGLVRLLELLVDVAILSHGLGEKNS